jgi:hypothetical protein
MICRFRRSGQRREPRIGHADRRRHSARWCRTDSWRACAAAVWVRALNRVDLPTLGRPTMPHLKPITAVPCSSSGPRSLLRRRAALAG